jgi:hypothetical protein
MMSFLSDTEYKRLVRIETRLAKLQEYLCIPTRITQQAVEASPFNDASNPAFRLMRIETRIYQLLDAFDIDPKTGRFRN